MWGIFLESVEVFKSYAGYYENKYLFGIFLFFLLYLWLKEKDKRLRIIFVYVPTLILIAFFCPLFRKVFAALFDDAETYYRLLWLLQMSMVSAYGALKICGRHRAPMLALMCIAVIACGSYVYSGQYVTKAENAYHLPAEAVEVAGLIEPEEGRVMALVPADLIYYIRQYSSRINMPYGREMLIDRWELHNDMYDAMERAEVIDTPYFSELARSYGCDYVVLEKNRELNEPLTDHGFEVYAETGKYIIYLDAAD